MKRNNKKGFTIVELVIVIAVIAILSAVLIPTFGGVTAKAQDSARDQIAKSAHTAYLVHTNANVGDIVIEVTDNDGSKYYYWVENGQFDPKNDNVTDSTVTTAVLAAAKLSPASGNAYNTATPVTDTITDLPDDVVIYTVSYVAPTNP